MRHSIFVLSILVAIGTVSAIEPAPRNVTFEDRVAAQKAIEQVYWNHRIWPKENPGPKPPLAAVMPDATIRAKVDDYLRKSMLLDSFWHQPITGDQLQAEVTRMARQTKAPETLRELFAALHDDPFVIAECLARATLAQRRVERLFAGDARIHGAQRAALVSKLAGGDAVAALERLDARHEEMTFVLDEGVSATGAPVIPSDRAIHLTREEWNRVVGRLAASIGVARRPSLSRLPVGWMSPLLDRGDRFAAFAVRAISATSLTLTSASWAKRRYADWSRDTTRSIKLDASAITPPPRGYATPALPAAECTDDTWTPTAGSEVPDERFGHTAVWTGSEMIVWGGQGEDAYSFNSGAAPSGIAFNRGGVYHPATDSWIASSLTTGSGANVPSARSGHTAIWTGSEMIVWGGYGDSHLSTGGRYDPLTDTWAASSLNTGSGADVPSPRSGHTAVWTGSEMIIWGGYGDSYWSTGGRYNPSTDTWIATDAGAGVPTGRTRHTAVWTGSEMIVWGGQTSDVNVHDLSDGGRYNPLDDTWTPTSSGSNVPSPREIHSAIWTGFEMIVWGGFGDGYLSTGGRYDPSTDTWAACSLTTGSGTNLPSPRYGQTAVWTGSEMIVWGGNGEFGSANAGGLYDPATDSWIASSLVTGSGDNVPTPRSGHTAVWTGSEMIIWGGSVSGGLLDTGGRYSPSTDTWSSSILSVGSGQNVPSAIQRPSAFWTGSEMIVWASSPDGYDFGKNPGGRYDPATDSWSSSLLSDGTGVDVPRLRQYYSVVWTGSEMIVWGGLGWPNSNPLNTGGRYSPSTDTWIATSLTSGTGDFVPVPRFGHSAVWTGSEMIVWGGDGGVGSASYTGGRYDPSSDTWAPSSLYHGFGANSPAPCQFHSAVWTGTEMIVWGGRKSGGFGLLQSGGRYDPSTDSWAASSLLTAAGAHVPSARYEHTAIWSGSEMIVWGGLAVDATGLHASSDGGRYDPSTDTWVATSTGSNTPSGRALHSAIWSGSEMIVWGGQGDFHASVQNGGRYSPWTDSWAPTSLASGVGAGTPAPRNSHAAIWTGSADHRMIVWGGLPATHSGGLYCAVCTPLTWYQDFDGDGRGNPAVTQSSCTPPSGYVLLGDDCDDTTPTVHPGAPEICDGIDDSCDGVIDNGGAVLCDDANVCTADTCNGVAACAHAYNTLPCDDGNACTTNDTCNNAGSCVGGPALSCDDAIVCTADSCDGVMGCLNRSANSDTADFSATRVDGRDLVILADAWNSCPADPSPSRYNPAANLDAVNPCIEMTDFHLFMTTFGLSCR